MEREFLGWQGAALDRAAEWILRRVGENLEDVLVVLPGSRAARTLLEKLVLRAQPSWYPPRILTQGELIDEMVLGSRPVAGRLARTLAWSRALLELPRARLELLAAHPPAPHEFRGVLALAETVRSLHAELAQEGIGFERLARGASAPASAGEAERFAVLAEAQSAWRRNLDALGLADPHESRFAAIDKGEVDEKHRVILVGVADMNRLLRHLVQRLGSRATALVFAPESEASTFDELGCVRTEAWKDRDLPLTTERWHVVDGPDAQAERAIEILASLDARFPPEEISIGVCDEEVAPHLERRLAEHGVVARHAAGTPIERARPHRLLAELAAWLPRREFEAYAELLRQPDLEAALRARSGAIDPVAALDAYHARHLPAAIDGRWLPGHDQESRKVHAALLELLGDLASSAARPTKAWPAAIRAFLASTYSDPIDPKVEEQRVLAESLESISEALAEIESLPGALGEASCSAAAAIDLLLSMSRGSSVSPQPAAQGVPEIELLGWLELPLDPASVLVVTGFQEGSVPASRRDDPFLPDGLRRKLGLPCSDDRVARDLYAASALLSSRREVAFVSGRVDGRGDPLLASRLAFHVPRRGILERVGRLQEKQSPRRGRPVSGEEKFRLPRLERSIDLASMRVTAFADYLRSPYYFYLRHVLRLETIDDRAREMDARSSGSFAHDVLEEFGRGELRDSTDEREIASWLRRRVESLGQRQFGADPRPAVRLQLAQLALRLEHFARAQARRAAEGWRVHETEWKPRTEVRLDLGAGEPPMALHGQIDRIDVREKPGGTRLEWAILDYKTGASAKDPEKAHRNRSGWKDLQLPLYTLLARELAEGGASRLDGAPALGYFTVGKDESETGVALARWTPPDLESAFQAARDVVRCVRRGEFDDLGSKLPDDPILLAIAGRGLVAPAEEESGVENGEALEGEEVAG